VGRKLRQFKPAEHHERQHPRKQGDEAGCDDDDQDFRTDFHFSTPMPNVAATMVARMTPTLEENSRLKATAAIAATTATATSVESSPRLCICMTSRPMNMPGRAKSVLQGVGLSIYCPKKGPAMLAANQPR